MDSTIGVDQPTNLVDLQGEGGILEGLLHLVPAEEAQISSLLGTGALADLESPIAEQVDLVLHRRTCFYLSLDRLDLLDGLLFGTGHLFVA